MITAYFTRELSLLQPAFRLWVLVISVLVLAHMSYLSTRCRNPLVRARIPNLPLSLPPVPELVWFQIWWKLSRWCDSDVAKPTSYGIPYEDLDLETSDGVSLRCYLLKQNKNIATIRNAIQIPEDLNSSLSQDEVRHWWHNSPGHRRINVNSLLQAVPRLLCSMAMLETMATGYPLPKCSSFACDAMS